jgi:hypothetical protein
MFQHPMREPRHQLGVGKNWKGHSHGRVQGPIWNLSGEIQQNNELQSQYPLTRQRFLSFTLSCEIYGFYYF